MSYWRKKPIVVQAFRWGYDAMPEWAKPACSADPNSAGLTVETLEGVMRAGMGDYIIRGVAGEVYPCKRDIFEATYEPAEPKP